MLITLESLLKMRFFKIMFFYFTVIQGVIVFAKAQKTNCYLPSHPSFGWWSYVNEPSIKSPGLQVPERAILLVNCKDGYKLEGSKTMACINGTWTANVGKCLKSCPSIYSTQSLKVTCNYRGYETVNCTEPIEGALAEFKCASFYEDTRLYKSKALCLNGKWSEKIPECAPVCGRVIIRKKPTLIIHADETKKGEFPWQIAIYTVSNKLLICGGSLLSERVVLTAAHCLSDDYGNQMSKKKFLVVAGKYYRKFDHPDDNHYSQVSEIQDMFLSDKYEGDDQDFEGDIAIIITKTIFTFSPRVQPVCIDWSGKLEEVVFGVEKQKGYVSGWGNIRENSDPANELKSLRVPAISRKECQKLIPDIYRRYMTHDKFCAGYKDNGTSVCLGDSGGGLVFEKEGRFFIAGVVSLAPKADTAEGGCDSQQYGLYTLVYNYTDSFILGKITEFKVLDTEVIDCKNCITTTTTTTTESSVILPPVTPDTCRLPNHPENGRWSVLGISNKYSPGDYVTNGTTLKITCNDEYKYFDANFITCRGEHGWTPRIGQCRKKCPALENVQKTKVSCSFNNKKENCSEVYEGAIARFKCEPFYNFSSLNTKPSVCIKGYWDHIPTCVQTCGKINSTNGKDKYVPWHVDIFTVDKTGLKHACKGSLISDRIVVTAAQCFTNLSGQLRDAEEFAIATGKYKFSNFTIEEYSRVARIVTTRSRIGHCQRCVNEFGFMFLDKPLELSEMVQPVCTDSVTTVEVPIHKEGLVVTSWNLLNLPQRRQEIKVNILPTEECKNKMYPEDHAFLTYYTFCGTNNENLLLDNSSVGAGLVLKKDDKYYLEGVFTSTAATVGGGGEASRSKGIYLFTSVPSEITIYFAVQTQNILDNPIWL